MKIRTGKRFRAAVVLAVMIAVSAILTGCAEDKTPLVLNIDAVAESLYDGVQFEDELAKLDGEAVKYLYGIDDNIAAAVYVGSGATAEEIAVFDAGTEEAGETLLATVQKHVEDQIESYRNYVPAEVSRLEKAVIVREGRYVMLCVTDDDKTAEGLMEEAIGG